MQVPILQGYECEEIKLLNGAEYFSARDKLLLNVELPQGVCILNDDDDTTLRRKVGTGLHSGATSYSIRT